jgi:hypothetical protein
LLSVHHLVNVNVNVNKRIRILLRQVKMK